MVLAGAIKYKKRDKRHENWKGLVKTVIYSFHGFVHRNPKESTDSRTKWFNMIVGHKVKTEKINCISLYQ